LLDGQFFRLLEFSRRNPITATDPLDDFHCVGQAFSTGLPLPVELIRDLTIGQMASQFSNLVDNRRRIAHAVCYVERKLHRNISTGAALPANVNQKLLLMGRPLDDDVLATLNIRRVFRKLLRISISGEFDAPKSASRRRPASTRCAKLGNRFSSGVPGPNKTFCLIDRRNRRALAT
jgi:hypothetical protein